MEGIIKCYGVTREALTDHETPSFCMFLEYCEFGSLQSLSMFTIPFLEQSAFIIINQISRTVLEMHKRNIVHSDLKEGNILISKEQANSTNSLAGFLPLAFKVADLGIAKDLSQIEKSQLSMCSGTPKYMAFEQFKGKRG